MYPQKSKGELNKNKTYYKYVFLGLLPGEIVVWQILPLVCPLPSEQQERAGQNYGFWRNV